MTERVTVSVVTPCFNGAAFLRQTIASVVGQTKPALEMIVIDDGSTDDSAAIAESAGAPVRLLRQPNSGESVARNWGIREARGSHLLFLDADDLLAPQAIERLTAHVAEDPRAVAVMGSAFFWDHPGQPSDPRVPSGTTFFPHLIRENLAPVHAWLVPKAIVEQAGCFFEPMRWFEEWDLWWRVGLLAPTLVPVSYVGALYRQHAKSQLATTRLADRARGHACLMERMAAAFVARPPLLAQHGEALFWSSWTALRRAHAFGVPWVEVSELVRLLDRLLAEGPRTAARSRTGLAIRLLGPRAVAVAEGLISPIRHGPDVHAPKPVRKSSADALIRRP